MKIVLIGATGTIGKAVAKELTAHDVISVGFNQGDYQVDIEDRGSIESFFKKIGQVDAIISTSGNIAFAPVTELNYEQYKLTIDSKLMGQLNIFQIGKEYVRPGGSITLSSGVLAQNPMSGGAAVSLVNAGLDAFAKAAAFELGDTLRINTVSPHFVTETMEMMGMDSSGGISATDTAKAYIYALNSNETGQVFDVANYI
ncbi:short chain dehydrogenase [uncultured Shewanella sp.]|uniref:short chain dehydrogenase n=1 Tax=uncultured Shewanella sp. TaxID=173975 RepID=UPI00261A8C1C|nr:short chain dehydrogenase [uncultured Shewanella sp.]